MEKSCWEPSTTTAVSWGSPPLSQPSPPVGEAGDRLGHPKMWKPGWGSQGGRRGAGSKSSSRGGHGDILRARGRREAPICLPCWLSWMRAVLLVHKTAPQHHDVCGMQDPEQDRTLPREQHQQPMLRSAPETQRGSSHLPKTQNLLIVCCTDV